MVNGGVDLRAHPGDLALERGDALLELLDRQGIEILLRELHQRIAGLAREELFEVHARRIDRSEGGCQPRGACARRVSRQSVAQ